MGSGDLIKDGMGGKSFVISCDETKKKLFLWLLLLIFLFVTNTNRSTIGLNDNDAIECIIDFILQSTAVVLLCFVLSFNGVLDPKNK
jgi:hypothetical protein